MSRKYFTIEELLYSDTAIKKKIKNEPTQQIISNIEELIDVLLEPMREDWTKYCEEHKLGSGAIKVTSGYRCPVLNKAVGGSPTSMHLKGYAADIIPFYGQMKKFQIWVEEWIKDKPFDKLIFEKPKNGICSWIHVALYGNNNEQRKQIFTLV